MVVRELMPQEIFGDSKSSPKLGIFMATMMVFLGALLLFWMEPLVGRMLTPHFGGAVHVWLLCLMFFQAMLLVGYLYAHYLARKLGPYHLLILLLPLLNLPLFVRGGSDPHTPLLSVLALLLSHVALPFVVLATTAVVAQSWLSRSSAGKYYEAYPLYAASNAGALIALVGYTFVAEPLMGLRTLSFAWTWIYAAYAFSVAAAWLLLRPELQTHFPFPGKGAQTDRTPIPSSVFLRWFVLSCLPSAYLLAVTNLITMEIGSFPLTWVAPLALYLASFIVTFRPPGGVPRYLKLLWPEILVSALLFYFMGPTYYWLVIIGALTTFFMICCLAHGHLYEMRPPADHLTKFYLTLALGGWVGGAIVSLIVPFLFLGLFEYPFCLLFLGIAFWDRRRGSLTAFWPRPSLLAKAGRILLAGLIIFFTAYNAWLTSKDLVQYRSRNFYGIYRVIDAPQVAGSPSPTRKLAHGMTLHGAQFLNPKFRLTPITYYHVGGGISDVFEATKSPRRIAVIGLGSGVTAVYATKDDTITYYEIDPDNEWIARAWFTYLDECRGKVNVVVGDGRLSLQKENGIKYDIILIDAFTGDGIPANLLTREAMKIYLDRLAPHGVILFHVSNRNYELRPALKSTAQQLNLFGVRNVPIEKENLKPFQNSTKCMVFARNPERLEPLLARGWVKLGEEDGMKSMAAWTDDYINILDPLIENVRTRWAENNKG
jgi:predicted O-methyltransferase YrrM